MQGHLLCVLHRWWPGCPGSNPGPHFEGPAHWKLEGTVFPDLPEWAKKEIPGGRGAWAPDISFFNGKYHLYYAVSTFGSRNSAIGLATNQTLDRSDPAYKWVDEGMVLRSYQDKDDWNAIDANLVIEATTENWRGPGHEAVLQERGHDYLVFHAYHGKTGRPFLQISTMVWEDGWPRVGTLP